MTINAIVERTKGGTLVLDLPRNFFDLYEDLQSVSIDQSPQQITLTDKDESDIRVKLYSEDEVGKHLILVLTEEDSLADANLLAFIVGNANDDFKSELEQNILLDRYGSMQEIVDAIKQMQYESGPIKEVFYCPLEGNMDEGEGNIFVFSVSNRCLRDYQWAIEEALEKEAATVEMDMAEFFDRDAKIKAKLASAKWGVEEYRGYLFGRIECSLREDLTESETEILTDWISGQNSDGFGENFEQRPIDTEEGTLYVSFWNASNSYSIMTHDELDEYIDNLGMKMGGM